MAQVDGPFPPATYDVVVVGSGPGGLQAAYSLGRAGVERVAVLSRDDAPGGMFRRFPVFQRLISWTKPQAPVEPQTREYEWYDHNSLLGDDPAHRALVPQFMDRSYDLPARAEMEAGLRAFVDAGGIAVRYGCEVTRARRENGGFALETPDGEYRCRALVLALGVTEAWLPPIPGADAARHYVDAGEPSDYDGRRVLIIGKRNSGFELAHGLLPWAREITLVSPRPVQTAVVALSGLRLRYLHPYEEYVRGGSGTFVVDGALERIERHGDGFRVHAAGTTWPGELELDADDVIVATGFRTPLQPFAELELATVADGRIPAQTPFWESVSAPGVYFAGNATQGAAGISTHGAAASSTSVNGFRYNARVLARHIAVTHFGLPPQARALAEEDVVPFLVAELTRAPELWIQKGYLARVVTADPAAGLRDAGIEPLAHFVDTAGPPAVAATVEVDATGTVVPVLYARRDGHVDEHVLPPHPLRRFDEPEHRERAEAAIRSLR